MQWSIHHFVQFFIIFWKSEEGGKEGSRKRETTCGAGEERRRVRLTNIVL